MATPPAASQSDFPAKLVSPAQHALVQAGYTRLDQLTTVRASDLKQLRAARADRGLAFADEPSSR